MQLLQRCLIALPIFAAIIGILPVVVLVFGTNGPGAATAYASAPAGSYLVAALAGADEDTILAVNTADPSVQFQIAGIAHAREVPTMGSVSPDGRLLALIVVEPGSPSEAIAALRIVDLETGDDTALLSSIDSLQEPVWASDSASVVVVRSLPGTTAGSNVELIQTGLAGDAAVVWTVEDAIAAYPLGFDAAGRLVAVRLDGSGSSAVRGDGTSVYLSPYFTRDWRMNADGGAVAFIEANQDAGLKYVPRVVALKDGVAVAAQVVAGGQALGAAWAPASPTATFGHEPGNGVGDGLVSAQSDSGGFDVPLAYALDGSLAAWHWTGASFYAPGSRTLVIASDQSRVTVSGVNRFFGWTTR